jgi:Domain of unknown function (DU1801)
MTVVIRRGIFRRSWKEVPMAVSKAATVAAYLKSLPPERRHVVSTVREVVLKNLPKGYRESMGYGYITYGVPLETYPGTYNGQPLCYAGLAAQKNHYALYLMGAYADPKKGNQLASEFKKRGKKLDMGKSCLRFKKLEDLPLDVIGDVIASTPPDEMIAHFEQTRPKSRR